jgi:arylsulfatase A-like enzyme
VFETYSDEILATMRNYDAEVRYTDHWVGELLKAVDDLGLRENTLVVLLSDHGESLGEHDYQGHGRALYENIVRIPLIFRLPGKIPAGKVIEEDVTLLDLAPTLIDLTVRPHAKDKIPDTFRGTSLAPAWTGETWQPSETIRYITWAGQRWVMPTWISKLWLHDMDQPLRVGYMRGSRKVVWEPRERQIEVTDLSADPHELRSTEESSDSAVYERESASMEHWHDITNKTQGESQMTEDDRKALKSLGYLQ